MHANHRLPPPKLELPLYCGHIFATVAHEQVIHVHATGHTSGDGIRNAIYVNVKKCDQEDAALGHRQLLVMRVRKDCIDPNPKMSV